MPPPSFRLFKARGQPGVWYGYVTIGDLTYKIDAKHVGERQNKHFEGTVKRHLKADQGKLPLESTTGRGQKAAEVSRPLASIGAAPDFDDELPF